MSEDQAPAPTRVDVSNEAVERLIERLSLHSTQSDLMGAATLRAIAAQRDELLAALERAAPLLRCVTIGQVMGAGGDAIAASGLNPWCINEGRATRDDTLDPWWVHTAIARARGGAA